MKLLIFWSEQAVARGLLKPSPTHTTGADTMAASGKEIIDYGWFRLTKRTDKIIAWSVLLTLMSGMPFVAMMVTYSRLLSQVEVDGTKIIMQNVVQALDLHKREHGAYPSTLAELVERGTRPSMHLDKWGRQFDYQILDNGTYRLMSYGGDGSSGGEGFDEDLHVDSKSHSD